VAWRVVVLADVPNVVVGRRKLNSSAPEMNAVLETTGGAQRRIVLTVREAANELDAGRRGIEAVERALGAEIAGDPLIESIQPDEGT
jgi:hypothetical protein